MIVQAAHPSHYEWIEKRAGVSAGPMFRAIEAVDSAGRIHGMVGFDSWMPNSATLSIALDNPAAFRHLLAPAFRIPFVEFGRGLVQVIVLSTNAKSLRLVKHVGFKETHRVRDGWAVGADLVMFEMRRKDCRWLSENTKQEAA